MNRTRTRVAALLVAVVGLLAVVAPPPAHAADFTVATGETLLIPCESECFASFAVVEPTGAGTITQSAFFAPAVVFTPSPTFFGVATISLVLTNATVQTQTVEVVAPTSASASGVFTPVGRPGPCLLLFGGSTLTFGDVEVGGEVATSTNSPQLRGCAPAEVEVDITVGASDAVGPGGTITNVGSTCTESITSPTSGCALTGSSFVVEVGGERADSEAATVLPFGALPGDFAVASYLVQMAVSGGVPTTQQGSPFSFDITFTAVPA